MEPVSVDKSGPEVPIERDCFALLARAPIGRVVYSDRALPVIVPVNYTLDGNKLNLLMQFSVFPERERDWSLVQIALTDIKMGDTVWKYGQDIGKAVADIAKGEHVHVHNLKTKRW